MESEGKERRKKRIDEKKVMNRREDGYIVIVLVEKVIEKKEKSNIIKRWRIKLRIGVEKSIGRMIVEVGRSRRIVWNYKRKGKSRKKFNIVVGDLMVDEKSRNIKDRNEDEDVRKEWVVERSKIGIGKGWENGSVVKDIERIEGKE